jgi:hypothetical protein
MGKFVDLNGMIYGRLTVLSYYGVKGHETMWNCKCSCGNTKIIAKNSLINGTKSCGCLLKEINTKRCLIDLTGQRFGRWTVLCRDESKRKYVHWLCRCDCGTEKSVWNQSLKNGDSQSCGCYKADRSRSNLFKDITGLVFGRLTVLRQVNLGEKEKPKWLCRCTCGKEKILSGVSLRIGETRSCGCLQREMMAAKVGELNPTWKGGQCRTKDGYVLIKMPHHPNVGINGYVREHIYMMTLKIGRPLLKGETVHHKNGIKSDNRIENLELWVSNHGSGQRLVDLIPHWISMLKLYQPDALNQNLMGV